MTLKMGLERSQLFPEIFEILLRPLYTRNLLPIIFLVYNDLYLSKHLSSRAAAARRRGGDGCSLPAAHQNGRSTISNISGNSWDISSPILRVIGNFSLQWARRSAPHLWDRPDRPHCTYFHITSFNGRVIHFLSPEIHHISNNRENLSQF